ncbi:MAG: lysophospholipid acyltransferase family protein [Hyphomicrobiaceae bacterium]
MSDQAYSRRSNPSFFVRLLRPVGRLWLRAVNMRIVGELPDLPKFVLIGAPHTSNWDLPNALAAGLHYGVAINWMGKDSIFNWPFGGLMRWMGGIPVDRSKRNNAVTQMIGVFEAAGEMIVVVPPEGTRSEVERWKSGFYHIAVGAKVPIVMAFMDYNRREVGIKGVFYPTGNYEVDLPQIQAFYAPISRYKSAA